MAKSETEAEWLKTRATADRVGVNQITIWRWVKAGKFPRPTYFGARKRWRLADVEAWIAARVAESQAASP